MFKKNLVNCKLKTVKNNEKTLIVHVSKCTLIKYYWIKNINWEFIVLGTNKNQIQHLQIINSNMQISVLKFQKKCVKLIRFSYIYFKAIADF